MLCQESSKCAASSEMQTELLNALQCLGKLMLSVKEQCRRALHLYVCPENASLPADSVSL